MGGVVCGGDESHDSDPEAEAEHDVEGEPGEEEECPGPPDSSKEERVTDQLGGEARHDEVEGTGTSTVRQVLTLEMVELQCNV